MSVRTRADLSLILLAFLWGVSFALVKNALNEVSAVLFMAIRFTLAAGLLLAICGGRRMFEWPRMGLRCMVATGISLAGGYILQTTGLRFTTAGKSAFLTGIYIVLLPLLAFCVYQSAPQLKEWTGVMLASVGMALMNWDGTAWHWGLGEVLTVACAFLFAAHLLLLDRATRYFDARTAGFAQVAICAAVLWLMLPVVEKPFLRPSASLAWAIVFTTAFATALPFTLLAWAQQHTTPVRAGVLLALEMPFGALAGWWFLGEKLAGTMLAGAGLILAGVFVAQMKPGGAPEHLDEVGAPRR